MARIGVLKINRFLCPRIFGTSLIQVFCLDIFFAFNSIYTRCKKMIEFIEFMLYLIIIPLVIIFTVLGFMRLYFVSAIKYMQKNKTYSELFGKEKDWISGHGNFALDIVCIPDYLIQMLSVHKYLIKAEEIDGIKPSFLFAYKIISKACLAFFIFFIFYLIFIIFFI